MWLTALAGTTRLRFFDRWRNEEISELDVKASRYSDQRVDCNVRTPLLNPGVVGRQHPQPSGEVLLGLVPLLAQLLNAEAEGP